MTGGIVFNQLLAVKHQALALAQSIDVLVESMGTEQAAAPPVPPAEELKPADGACPHPLERRVPIPAMGPPKYKCMDCREDVLEDNDE